MITLDSNLIMKSELKFFCNLNLGLFKFNGNIEVNDILSLLIKAYKSKEFKTTTHTLLDFRQCSFEVSDVMKLISLVEEFKLINKNVKSALLVNEPKVTALTLLFKNHLNIPEKLIEVNSTLSHTIKVLNLSVSEEELEKMFCEML